VDAFYTNRKGYYLGRGTVPARWILFQWDGFVHRQAPTFYRPGEFMPWPAEWLAQLAPLLFVAGETDADQPSNEGVPMAKKSSSTADSEQTEAGLDVVYEQMELTEPLDRDQISKHAMEMADAQHDKTVKIVALDAMKERQKTKRDGLQGEIDDLEAKISALSEAVRTGKRKVNIEIKIIPDHHSKEMVATRVDTEEEVWRKTMTAEQIRQFNPPAEEMN
jgi:hypothetical protein